jgi:hypothetical protein
MEELRRLLVIDNDFHCYDTPVALNQAIDELREEGKRWAFYLHSQERGVEAFEDHYYHAILIDNDFGKGMTTLVQIMNGSGIGVPVAYVSAHDTSGLLMQNTQLLQKHGKPCIDPLEFENLGVSYIRKRGNHTSKELGVEDLRKSLADFLRFASS